MTPRRNNLVNRSSSTGFTLVELLIVIGIIAVLMGLLFPTIKRSRQQAQWVQCSSNLSQIYAACVSYANVYRDKFPDKETLGVLRYRRAPGEVDPANLAAGPETRGLAAVLGELGFLDGRSEVWICPSARDEFQVLRNTYAFSTSDEFHRTSIFRARRSLQVGSAEPIWVWDNFSLSPGVPNSTTNPPSLPAWLRGGPHRYRDKKNAVNTIFLDGHIDFQK